MDSIVFGLICATSTPPAVTIASSMGRKATGVMGMALISSTSPSRCSRVIWLILVSKGMPLSLATGWMALRGSSCPSELMKSLLMNCSKSRRMRASSCWMLRAGFQSMYSR